MELIHSLYHAFRADCNEHLRTFEEALAAQDDRRAGRRANRRTYFKQGLVYNEIPRYTEQIRRYFECFGRERVHVATYDEFATNPGTVFEGILNFLGVEPTLNGNHFPVINENHSPKSHLLKTILSDPLIRGTAISMRSWLPGPAFSTLQKAETWLMKANVHQQKRRQLKPDLLKLLKLEFKPEVERLSELLGRDLTHWNKVESQEEEPAVDLEFDLARQMEPARVFELGAGNGSIRN